MALIDIVILVFAVGAVAGYAYHYYLYMQQESD